MSDGRPQSPALLPLRGAPLPVCGRVMGAAALPPTPSNIWEKLGLTFTVVSYAKYGTVTNVYL